MNVCVNDIVIESEDRQAIFLLNRFFYGYQGKGIYEALKDIFKEEKIREFARREYFDLRDGISSVGGIEVDNGIFHFNMATETAYVDNIEEIMVIVRAMVEKTPVNVYYCSSPDPADDMNPANNDIEGKYFDFRYELEVRDNDYNLFGDIETFSKKEELVRFVEQEYVHRAISDDTSLEEIQELIMDLPELEDGYADVREYEVGLKPDCSDVIL